MQKLTVIMKKFQVADNLLDSIYLSMYENYGVTEEYLARECEAMTQRARARDDVA